VLLYTDGLTEARHNGELVGLDRVSAALGAFTKPHRPRRSPFCARASPTTPLARSPTISVSSPPASPGATEALRKRRADLDPPLILGGRMGPEQRSDRY
jgi:hypothetical protein